MFWHFNLLDQKGIIFFFEIKLTTLIISQLKDKYATEQSEQDNLRIGIVSSINFMELFLNRIFHCVFFPIS